MGNRILFLFVGLLLLWHLLAGQVGYPSGGSDFGAHFTIVEEIKHGHFFTEAGDQSVSDHTVSKYLPIYAGILGAHLLTLLIHWISGMSIVKVMLLVSDLAVILTFWGLFKLAKRANLSWLGVGYLFATQGLLLLYQFEFGFYAQTLGIAMGYVALTSQRRGVRSWLSLVAGICYPDIFLWILPTLIYEKWQAKMVSQKIQAVLLGVLFFVFFGVILSRVSLSGSAEVEWLSYVVFLFVLVFLVATLQNETRFMLISFAVVTLVLLAFSEARFGQFRYYARKPLYWSPFFLAMALPEFRWKQKISFCLLPLCLSMVWEWDSIARQLKMVASSSGAMTANEEAEIRSLLKKEHCEEGVFLPSKLGQSATAFQMMNAITGQSDFAKMKLRSVAIGTISTTDPNLAFERSRELPTPRATYGDWNLYCELASSKGKYASIGE